MHIQVQVPRNKKLRARLRWHPAYNDNDSPPSCFNSKMDCDVYTYNKTDLYNWLDYFFNNSYIKVG